MTPFSTIKYESFFEFKVNDATPTSDSSIKVSVVLNAAIGLLSLSEMRPITNTSFSYVQTSYSYIPTF